MSGAGASAEPRAEATRTRLEVVTAGSVSVFSVPVGAAGEVSGRRYLATFEVGDGLFRVPAGWVATGSLIVTPSSGAATRARDLESLDETGSSEGGRWLETWVTRLSASLSALPPAAAHVRLSRSNREPVTLEPGRTARPEGEGVAWLEVLEGEGRFAGLENASVRAGSGAVPLAGALWFEATGDARVRLLTSEEVLADPAALEANLALFERCLHTATSATLEAERASKKRQLDARLKRSRFMTAEAMSDLASLLRSKSDRLRTVRLDRELSVSSPLFAAASAVGQALGIELRAPADTAPLEHAASAADAIARASQVRVRDVVLRPGWHRGDSGPLLGSLAETGAPVALLPDGPSRYSVLDPEARTRTPVSDAVAATIAPSAIAFYRPFPEGALTHGALLRFSIKGCERDVLALGAIALLAGVLGLMAPQATAILIDSAIPAGDRGLLVQIFAVLVGAALAIGAFQVAIGMLNVRIQSAADHALQTGLWDHLLRLRMSFFRGFSSGDLQTRVMAVRQIRQALSGTVLRTVITSAMALLQLVLLLSYSPELALVAVLVFVVQLVTTTAIGAAIVRTNRELVTLDGSLFGLLVQLLGGVSKLRVTGADRRAFAHWAKGYARKQRLSLRVKTLQDRVTVLNAALSMASLAVVFYAAEQTLGRGLSTGTFLAFNAAFGAFLGGASMLSETITSLLDVVNLAERARPILAATPESDRGKVDPGTLEGGFALDRVVFRYRANGPHTLDGVSIEASPGELVALVGESGSGKSTIVKLLLGFEHPEAGTVSFDGQDAQSLDLTLVRRQLGVVVQGGRIAQGSIHENIAEGRSVSIAEAQDAIRRAGLEEDLAALPMGIHTVVSEGGSNLSGGQRQRLLIARAIVARPKLLIFDEATSALDNRTQAIVNEALEALRVTRLVIAHRLSTVRKADRIYVLEQGRVVEVGTFDVLATKDGPFSKLLKRQMA